MTTEKMMNYLYHWAYERKEEIYLCPDIENDSMIIRIKENDEFVNKEIRLDDLDNIIKRLVMLNRVFELFVD